jgi:HlyD family secretion protein
MMSATKWIAGLAFLTIVILGSAFAMQSQDAPLGSKEVAVKPQQQWAAIAKGRVDVQGGTIRLAAQREGLINQVLVEEGDRVKAGQVLAVLETTAAQLSVDQAIAELAVAKGQLASINLRANAARMEAARALGSKRERIQVSNQIALIDAEYNQAKLNIASVQKRLDVLTYEIEARTVRAPLDGRIIRRSAKPGDGASTQTVTELFLLAPDAPRIIKAELDEQMVNAVKPGQVAEITLEFNDTKKYAGKLIRIGSVFGISKNKDDPNAVQDTRVVELVTTIEGADELRIGQRVLVQIKP